MDNSRTADGLIAPPQSAGDLFDRAVARFADRPAIDFLGRVWDWAEIGDLANRAAAGLQRCGVVRGARVGLCLPNTPYSIIMYYAILKAGGTVVNFNPLYTERELTDQVRDSGTSVMVTIDLAIIMAKVAKLAAAGMFQQVIVCSMVAALPRFKGILFRVARREELSPVPAHDPYIRFETLVAPAAKPVAVAIDPVTAIAVLQYTGGTTGTPKAAMLSHANITTNVAQFIAANPALESGRERIIGVLPFFHGYAMTVVMNLGVTIGAELVLLPRPDMKLLMATIARKRPTILPGVPTLFTAIGTQVEAAGGMDLSFVRFCMSGGAPISHETAERFKRLSGCTVLEGYGLSETSPIVSATPPDLIKSGSVGRALPGTIIEIRDPENPAMVLPQGARGEICVRGPQVMQGYYNRPEETAAVFVDGALRTGDIGYLDEDGFLFIVDRIKDLILCSGYNVYPRIIEEAAYRHPAVLEAIAIGVADAYRGQTPKLFVTLRPDTQATGGEILAFLREHLNQIEIPKSVEIRDTLPRTMVGKLSKKELIAEEAAKHSG